MNMDPHHHGLSKSKDRTRCGAVRGDVAFDDPGRFPEM
jgi:hypothetical protein